MPSIRAQAFFTEEFQYNGRGVPERRFRTTGAVAFLAGDPGANAAPAQFGPIGRNVQKKCLSMLGTTPATDDTRKNDFALPLYDAGHLLGDQYGGLANSFNLVPMLRSRNRGGVWNTFETAVAGFSYAAMKNGTLKDVHRCVVAVKCFYDTAHLLDPRVPNRIEGVLLPLNPGQGKLLEQNWSTHRATLGTAIANAGKNALTTAIAQTQVSGTFSTDQSLYKAVGFDQPYLSRDEPFALADEAAFVAYLREAQWKVETGWLIEDQGQNPFQARPDSGQGWAAQYRLPRPAHRPYAALDYMALAGQLTAQLQGISTTGTHIASDTVYDAATFSPPMKSFAMHMNLLMNEHSVGSQGYASDARHNRAHPDIGTIGEGLMLTVEYDHAIPRQPLDGGLPGPTIFSNLHMVSPSYNSSKGNQLWVAPGATVGWLRDTTGRRAATKRNYVEPEDSSDESSDDERPPAKRQAVNKVG